MRRASWYCQTPRHRASGSFSCGIWPSRSGPRPLSRFYPLLLGDSPTCDRLADPSALVSPEAVVPACVKESAFEPTVSSRCCPAPLPLLLPYRRDVNCSPAKTLSHYLIDMRGWQNRNRPCASKDRSPVPTERLLPWRRAAGISMKSMKVEY